MKLIAGLGNPGSSYKRNRHNTGFMILDSLAKSQHLIFKKKKLYEYVAAGDDLLIKPRTFMNRSGIAFTSISTNNSVQEIMVVYDDINLPFGEIRFRHKGSAGGHNGLKSIIAQLGSDEFKRLRVGVGAPAINQNLADYVLSDFTCRELELLPAIISYSVELLNIYVAEDFESLLNYHSKNKETYSEKLAISQDQ